MTEQDLFDKPYENQPFRGCVLLDDGRRVRLCECDDCTSIKRTTCQVKKLWIERYGFHDYQEMKEV